MNKKIITKVIFISTILFGLSACNPYKYSTPVVMPAGKSELKKRQIRRGY